MDDIRYVLETVNKTVRIIICRVYFPFVVRAVMGRVQNPISRQVPHLRIGIGQILFHTQERFFGTIDAILHFLELCKRFLNWPVPVDARSGRSNFFTPVGLHLLL